jgi:hypothetical protein
MRVRLSLAGAAAGAVLLAAAAPAPAATPFTAGTGSQPAVAVGSDGTGHVVWTLSGEPADIGYCRVSPGGTSCNRTAVLGFGSPAARDLGRPRVFTPAPNKVVVVASCWNCGGDLTYRWVSTNNGTSFGTPVLIGSGFSNEGHGTWLDDLGIFVGVSGSRVKAMDAATGGNGFSYASGGTYAYEPEVVRVPGTNKLVAAVNNLGAVKYANYNGVFTTVAGMNNVTNWTIDRTLTSPEGSNSETSLSSGPAGVYLAYKTTEPGNDHLSIRRLDEPSATFGGPTRVEGPDPIDNDVDYPDSTQDAAGRLHFVWRSLYDGGRLRYRATGPAGSGLGPVGNLALRESFYDPQIAAGPSGTGFTVWTHGTAGAVRVVPLDPQPEPPAPPAPPPATGGGTIVPPPAGTTPPTTPPSTTPRRTPSSSSTARYTGPRRATTVRVAGGSVSLGVPRRCVNPGQRFTVTLRWKRQKRKGNKFVKVRRADFYIGKRRVRIDRKAPFTHTMRVTASTKRGSTITLRARAFIKVRRGKSPTKSIRTTVKVCS